MLTLFLIALFSMVFLSVPIAFALIVTAIVLMVAMDNVSGALMIQNMVRGVDSFPLMAIPFFILSGEIMSQGGISKRLVQFSESILGFVKGGLGYAAVLACMIFAGVSGSAVADTSAIGSMVYPVMKERYNPEKSAALFTAAGCIGPIIPPSIPMILFGVIANVSIVKLFLGGIIPGILIGIGLMIGWYFHSKKMNYPSEGKFNAKKALKSLIDSIWALILPGIILGGIVFGIFTPTEAGVIAAVYAFITAFFIYRELKLKDMPRILVLSARITAVVMLVVGAATAAGYFITTAQIPTMLMDTLTKLSSGNRVLLMIYINILLLIVGCVMDLTPALLILGPMLLPLVLKNGIDPIYFGVVMVVNLCIGLLTPPVGTVLFVGCGISKIPMGRLAKAIAINISIMVVVLFLITFVPSLITFIPNLVKR
ncbi:MAG TPA: TRAP transporter large permease [Nitrospirota bacterium]|nr:TRAP transporter large permease [Nitrospirota bacterium]